MSQAALTAKYRPQTFAQVAGQDTLKHILSRAALEDKVAPAYLFSGTRGVGKTTLARIFAKALNCRQAPSAEPCNTCDRCKAIMHGNAVDVVEIDGASNRGIDDVRRLKEVVGYAPMDGRYKIFIIDEAHMLSREAFNALLKTLEEPPAGVTFIMATTEPHKFPATIISRCQHYVFKRLPEKELIAHLASVLQQEAVEYDPGAVRLIARRGAGSVRDSMSLLGQVLALGQGALTESAARSVLGLAGHGAFIRIITACKEADTLVLCSLLRELLDQGLDMGFFLRELCSLWRDLFMLRQSGETALPLLEMPEEEAVACLELVNGFTLPHIHACWHMTLEGQRRVLTSLEPALALELLLLNLAMLPKLLSLEQVSAMGRQTGQTPQVPPTSSPPASRQGSVPGVNSPRTSSGSTVHQSAPHIGVPGRPHVPNPAQPVATPLPPQPEMAKRSGFPLKQVSEMADGSDNFSADSDDDYSEADIQNALAEISDGTSQVSVDSRAVQAHPANAVTVPVSTSSSLERDTRSLTPPTAQVPDNPASSLQETVNTWQSPSDTRKSGRLNSAEQAAHPEWTSFLEHISEEHALTWLTAMLTRTQAHWEGNTLVLEPHDDFIAQRLAEQQTRQVLEPVLTEWCGRIPEISIMPPLVQRKSRKDLHDEVVGHPLVKGLQEQFDARVVDYGQLHS